MQKEIGISKHICYYMVMFLVLVLEHNCFYLLPNDLAIFGLGISDLCVLFEIALFLFVLSICKWRIPKTNYNRLIIIALIIVITSSIAGYFTYGQSIFAGINVQRNRIASLLYFFVILIWYKRKKITSKGILKTLGIFLFIYLSICISQYFLSSKIIFVHTGAEGSLRYGTTRFWFSGIFLVLFSAFCVDNLFEKKSKKVKSTFVIIIALMFFFIITKTRMSAIAFCGALTITLIFHKGSIKTKTIGVIAVIAGFMILSSTSMGNDIMNIVMGKESSQGDTLTVREIGQEYYIKQTLNSPRSFLFGCGYASANNSLAKSMTYPSMYSSAYGYIIDLYPQDNGVIGMFYYYGFLGISWWIIAMIYSFKKAKRIYKNTGNFAFIFFLIFDVMGSLTTIPFMLEKTTVTAIFWLLMLDYDRKIEVN